MLSAILLSMLMILLSILSVIRHLICGNNLNWLLNLNLIYETLWTGAGSGLLISMLEKLNWLHLASLITLELWMWKWMDVFLRKDYLLRCWGWLSQTAKTASKKIGALIRSMKCISPEVDLYNYKSMIQPYMKYCFRVWAGAPSCYFELLDKIQNRYAGLLALHLLSLLNPCLIVKM